MIGIGNPLSRDDEFGPRVLDRLIQCGQEHLPDTDFVQAGTDLLGRIDLFPGYSRVVLVDALLDPEGTIAGRGSIVAVAEEVLLGWPETSPGVHEFSPLVAVQLFRRLYPEANTRFTLVAFCTDKVRMKKGDEDSLDEGIIDAAVRLVYSLLGSS